MNESTNRRGLKTTTFQMRMDPEVKRQAEDMFAHYGLSLTDAVNIFIRQSLNRNGLPFILSPEDQEYQKQWAIKQLMEDLELGINDPKSHTEDEVYKFFGVEKK